MSSVIQYTARRSLLAGHVVGTKYEIVVEIAIDSLNEEIEEVKFIERSPGGEMEQGLERIDVRLPFRIILAGGSNLMQMREFLDSTESGESFRIYTCEDFEDSPTGIPIVLKRLDEGHTEIPFIRKGRRMDDMFAIDLVGLVSSIGETDTDGVDIYDETNDPGGGGTGGLQPPPLAPGSTDPRFVAGQMSTTFVTGYSNAGDFVGVVNGPQQGPGGTLIEGGPIGATAWEIIRDKQNAFFPFQIVIRSPAVASPETYWFTVVTVKDSGGTPVTDGVYTVGMPPAPGFYDFNDTDIGGGVHEYVWRWNYFSTSAGVDLTDGVEFLVEFA